MLSYRNDSHVSKGDLNRLVRVVVADSFPIVLMGLRKLIEDDPRLLIVGEFLTMSSLLDMVKSETPDVALVDWSLASDDLKTTSALLHPNLRKTAVVFFTASDDPAESRAMIKLGAQNVVSKRASAAELQTAVWNASHRSLPSDPSTSGAIPVQSAWMDPQERIRQLTRRERQLIPLVCGGMRNKAIADYLGIAESTVWHHLTAVFTKLQVDDRMALAAFAYRQGIVMTGRMGIAERLPLGEAS